jgi:hypothetical protein
MMNTEAWLGLRASRNAARSAEDPFQRIRLPMNDDAGFYVFHAACAAALATDLIVDMPTFFHPPAPYHQFFVLTTQAGECNNERGGTDGINGSRNEIKAALWEQASHPCTRVNWGTA